ncbi:MAG: transposase [Chloroflexota bacterium]
MSTFTQVLYQMVFGSKDYKPFLSSGNENLLYAYLAGILKNKECHSYIVGGCSNHIHIISHIHPTLAPAYLIKDIKKASHKMMKESNLFSRFSGWQVGYGLFTYHISSKQNLIKYVLNQNEHHKTITYKNELITLLKEHSVDYTEEYLLT